MTDTANLGLPVIEAAQAQKHVTHNEALRILDALVQLAVLDRDLTAPPGAPNEGERWIVAAAATGDWAGHDDDVAAWQDGAWQFSTPKTGWLAYAVDEAMLLAWDGAAWGAALDFLGGSSELQNVTLLGVGTTADSTNPFSAKLNNALWVAETAAEGGSGDLRYKLSKEAAANTLSFLLQDNFSGRAEIGLTGDDDFHCKVSADGSSWTDAIVIDKTSGLATLAGDPTIALGAATKQYVDDAVAGGGGGSSYTDEDAQDAVGAILADSTTIDFTYDDAGNSITAAVIDNAIGDAKLRQGAARTVIGRAANSSGNVADIADGGVHTVLSDDGSSLAFRQPSEADLSTSDITTNDVSATKHGFAPKSPADATQFLNGAATRAFAAVKDSDLATSDITTNDVSTTKHGFAPKAPNDTAKFLRGDATWAGLPREVLSADRTYYVRTDGSDSNDGLSNSSGGAFLTIAKAMAACTQIDFNGHTVTVQLGNGTYSESVNVPKIVGQGAFYNFILQGDTSTPSNVVISQSGSYVGCIEVPLTTLIWVKGVKVVASSGYGIAVRGGYIKWSNCDFGAVNQGHIYVEFGVAESFDAYTISGDATYHFQASGPGAFLKAIGQTVTISGSRAISVFASATMGGVVNAASIDFGSWTVTGTRYGVETNAVVQTFGAGASFFPGDTAGYTASGGQYA